MVQGSQSTAEVDSAREKILLVEDNKANLQMLYELLEATGCKLLVARNGETGLSVARKMIPNLILLDIMMPGIDGLEVCRRLKADKKTRGIPVIFLSALDKTDDKVKGLQLGAVDYISKPFQPEEVIARVNTHLTIHRLSHEVQDQKDKLEHELSVVSQLQRRIIPERLPELPGIRLAVHYTTSRFAGGDYYDVVNLPDGRCGILVADAEGHSAPATVMMAMTCALFRSRPEVHNSPDRVLSIINMALCNVNHSSFVTAVYAVYDLRSRSLELARAGHPQPLLFRSSDQRTQTLPVDAVLPMGFQPYDRIPVTKTSLDSGDRLLFFTDGVIECFNPENQLYGEERLRRQLAHPDATDPQQVVDAVVRDMEAFARDCPLGDDQALLVAFID